MLPGGKPKIWLAFSQQYMQRINDFIHKSCQSAMLRSSFCANHLRHKCFIISWQLLEHLNIPYTVVSQEGSTCIISLPGGYHQTYATGISYSEVCARFTSSLHITRFLGQELLDPASLARGRDAYSELRPLVRDATHELGCIWLGPP